MPPGGAKCFAYIVSKSDLVSSRYFGEQSPEGQGAHPAAHGSSGTGGSVSDSTVPLLYLLPITTICATQNPPTSTLMTHFINTGASRSEPMKPKEMDQSWDLWSRETGIFGGYLTHLLSLCIRCKVKSRPSWPPGHRVSNTPSPNS